MAKPKSEDAKILKAVYAAAGTPTHKAERRNSWARKKARKKR